MVEERIPVTEDETYVFHGMFKVNDLYRFIVNFLSIRKYEFFDKNFEEKKKGDEVHVYNKGEARRNFTDYYQVVIYYKMFFDGKEVVVDTKTGSGKFLDGSVKIIIFSYLKPNFSGLRPKIGSTGRFFSDVYEHFWGRTDIERASDAVKSDISDLFEKIGERLGSVKK